MAVACWGTFVLVNEQMYGKLTLRKVLIAMKRILAMLALVTIIGLASTSTLTTAQPPGDRGGAERLEGRDGRGFGGRGGFPGFGFGGGERIEPKDLEFDMGVASIPDRQTFEQLSYQGPDVMRDSYLAGLEFVKFIIENPGGEEEKIYWMNTENYRAHPPFMGMVGINMRGNVMRGAITWLPRLKSPDGSAGLYTFDFQPNDRFHLEEIKAAYTVLTKTMPDLKGKLAFHPLQGNVRLYEEEEALYRQAGIPVHMDDAGEIAYLPLNSATSFGRLRILDNDSRPSPRDIVICQTLPNQMPRVAGVISCLRQTPLSHVNLRAIQDKIPNAFVHDALNDRHVKSLMGKLVRYEVGPQGYTLREATQAEVDQHFAALRPASNQKLDRDLTERDIRPLNEIEFGDSNVFGVKATNLAAMHGFDLPPGTVPDGYAIPFYFYDEFMKHNGLYEMIDKVLRHPDFIASQETQEAELKKIRALIRKGRVPEWMQLALSDVQGLFPDGTSIRCRSSTNNEDLPGFSGAGLYGSYTHRSDEGHLSKSIKQVYASMWSFRAYEEREFYRVDHATVAMGVLLHPNYKDEQVNGVAVTEDILYETPGSYYVNTQPGEDLVTNPDESSSAEELLLGWRDDGHDRIVRHSVHAPDGILSVQHRQELRQALSRIYRRFANLYEKSDDDQFAMEIEFKVTKDGKLAVKQARPWVF